MTIRFTDQALTDIDAVYAHIAQDSPQAAQNVLDQIEKMIDHLPDHPKMGRNGRVEGTRELIIPGFPYVVAYELSDPFIDILAIIHTSRRWSPLLKGE